MPCATWLWTLPPVPVYAAVRTFPTLKTWTPSTDWISTVVATLADSTNSDMILHVDRVDVFRHDTVARAQHTSPRCTSESSSPSIANALPNGYTHLVPV